MKITVGGLLVGFALVLAGWGTTGGPEFVETRATQSAVPVVDRDGTIWAPDYGVVPNGLDCSAALQSLIAAMKASDGGIKGGGSSAAKIRLAPGRTVAWANWDALPAVRICGAGTGLGGSILVYSSAAQPVIGRNLTGTLGTVAVEITDLQVSNALGDAVRVNGIAGATIRASFNNCQRGLVMDRIGNPPVPNTNVHLSDCQFNHCAVSGMAAWARAKLDSTVCTQCGIGLDLSGTVDLSYLRAEENGIGAQFGLVSSCEGAWHVGTMEANLVHAKFLKNAVNFTVSGLKILGDKNNGTTYPTYGIDLEGGGNLTFISSSVGGTFTQAAAYIGPNVGQTAWILPQVGNTDPAKVWSINNPAGLTTFIPARP